MDSRNRPISGIDFFEHIVEDFDLVNWFEENIPTFYDFILATSSEDMSSGGYSEMFMDALSNGSEYAVKKSLDTLRNGDSEDGVADGFLYEKDPYNIREYQISNYIENFYDTEMFQRVIEHLKEIGVDFDDVRDGRIKIFLRGLDELKKHKLEIDTEYKIDKNRILRIKSIDTEKDYPRYMIRIDGTDGLVPIDALLSYLNNKSLFENQCKNTLTEQSRRDYLKWKRKNVTLRGIFEFGKENKGGGRYGSGLYTAILSNKDMAKIYGKVYFVLNAIPKTPKVVNDANLAEMFLQGIINNWCKSRGMSYNSNEFFKHTDIRTEMLNLGYDGLVIKGREMVNYTPPDNVKYFKHEFELENYYNQLPNQLN